MFKWKRACLHKGTEHTGANAGAWHVWHPACVLSAHTWGMHNGHSSGVDGRAGTAEAARHTGCLGER
eukprot:351879-Chlamydomonas_euryale.AAC.10